MRTNISSNTIGLVVNALFFQLIWWTCVLGLMTPALVALIAMFIHSLVWNPRPLQLPLLISLAVFGMVFDVIWLALGWYVSVPGDHYWLILLWCGFLLTLTRSLWSLVIQPKFWIGICTVFGPLAYYAGTTMGRLEVDPIAWPAVIFQWALFGWVSHQCLVKRFKANLPTFE